ncbi:hypothetical protein FA95DRAFT_1322115 [Auriscalpium vulgare]|uniref:Uncharacterized protein n=1 Tax=Auriscalpium vulgare TaxID=40419 RepID=A0ACB8S8F0_9AGAM|nr:hypothetical protein FA95DRAFT_1322115 [Auriscalpium vulgare]
MPKHTDPATIGEDLVLLMKLAHLFIGIFVWDLVTTLDFEWSLVVGARPFRWTVWLHTGSRVCALGAAILILASLDATAEIDCKVWVRSEWILGTCAPLLASVLIVLRVVAIWERNKFVVAFVVAATLANIALIIQNFVTAKSEWSPQASTCAIVDPLARRGYVFSICATDIALLVLMLFGLLRWNVSGSRQGIFSLMYKQGFSWMVIVTLSGVPAAIMLILNIDDPWNETFTISACLFPYVSARLLDGSSRAFADGRCARTSDLSGPSAPRTFIEASSTTTLSEI